MCQVYFLVLIMFTPSRFSRSMEYDSFSSQAAVRKFDTVGVFRIGLVFFIY